METSVNRNMEENQLDKLYTDTKRNGAFRGIRAFHRDCKAAGLDITIKKVKEFFSRVNAYNLYRPVRRKFERNPIYAHNVDQQWQADLADMNLLQDANDGHRYILTVVDTLSKYAFAEPIKKKNGPEVAQAFKRILNKAKPRKPTRLQTDKGKEFYNIDFKKACAGIQHFSSESDQKAAGVERFNRTIKTLLYRFMRHNSTTRWIDALDEFVEGYNATIHSRLGVSPDDAITMRNSPEKVAQLFKKTIRTQGHKGTPA